MIPWTQPAIYRGSFGRNTARTEQGQLGIQNSLPTIPLVRILNWWVILLKRYLGTRLVSLPFAPLSFPWTLEIERYAGCLLVCLLAAFSN